MYLRLTNRPQGQGVRGMVWMTGRVQEWNDKDKNDKVIGEPFDTKNTTRIEVKMSENKAREEAWEELGLEVKDYDHSEWTLREMYFKSGYNSRDKEVEELKEKCQKLKRLMLFTDPVVENELCGGEIQLRQWIEFVKCFPDEGEVNDTGK